MAFRNAIVRISQLIADQIIGAFIATAAAGQPRITLSQTGGQGNLSFYTLSTHEDPAVPAGIIALKTDLGIFHSIILQLEGAGLLRDDLTPVPGFTPGFIQIASNLESPAFGYSNINITAGQIHLNSDYVDCNDLKVNGFPQFFGPNMQIDGSVQIDGNLAVDGPIAAPTTFQAGDDSIVPSAANTPTTKSIIFATPFPVGTVPAVQVTPITSVPGTQVTGMSVNNVTRLGFDAILTRTNTTNTGFNWTAMLQTQ